MLCSHSPHTEITSLSQIKGLTTKQAVKNGTWKMCIYEERRSSSQRPQQIRLGKLCLHSISSAGPSSVTPPEIEFYTHTFFSAFRIFWGGFPPYEAVFFYFLAAFTLALCQINTIFELLNPFASGWGKKGAVQVWEGTFFRKFHHCYDPKFLTHRAGRSPSMLFCSFLPHTE